MTNISAIIAAVTISLQPGSSTINDELYAAQEWLENVNNPERYRFATLYNLPQAGRLTASQLLSGVLNHISISDIIEAPNRITESLLVIDLHAFGGKNYSQWLQHWEKFEPPYTHITTEIVKTNQRVVKGKLIKVASDQIQRVTVAGGWLDLTAHVELQQSTQSDFPLVRVDWLISQLIQPPFYYDFADVPLTIKEFYTKLGTSNEVINFHRAWLAAIVLDSQVSLEKIRFIDRWPTVFGGVWNTYDVNNLTPDKDFLRNPLHPSKNGVKHDAGENIATKSNGLHTYALYDGQGNRVNAAPSNIALDYSTGFAEELRPMVSCVRCHNRDITDEGLRTFNPTRILENVEIVTSDENALLDIKALFGRQRKLDRHLIRDRADYVAALHDATGGLTPYMFASSLARFIDFYDERPISLEVAKEELGTDDIEELKRSGDIVLLRLLAGDKIRRKQWEISFGEAALASYKIGKASKDEEKLVNIIGRPVRGN